MRERARLLRAGRTQPLVPLHSMPADYGFDPLGLGVNPASFSNYRHKLGRSTSRADERTFDGLANRIGYCLRKERRSQGNDISDD